MRQPTNQIALYRKIDEDYVEKAKLHFSPLTLSYESSEDEEAKYIELKDLEDSDIQVNEFDSMWSPNENNLKLTQTLFIDNHKSLFGEEGVTCLDNSIGFAVHIHSKSSSFQEIMKIDSFNYENENVKMTFECDFPAKRLRGSINLDFFLYVKDVRTTHPIFANKEGMKLTLDDLKSYTIIVDGEGSSFPITEFSEEGGPLWKVQANWIDPTEDIFDSSNLSLMFNDKHHMFNKVTKNNGPSSQFLFSTITIQAMAMIINKVVNIDGANIWDEDELMPGTIASAVGYWIQTFEVQTDDIFQIQSSLSKTIESQLTKG